MTPLASTDTRRSPSTVRPTTGRSWPASRCGTPGSPARSASSDQIRMSPPEPALTITRSEGVSMTAACTAPMTLAEEMSASGRPPMSHSVKPARSEPAPSTTSSPEPTATAVGTPATRPTGLPVPARLCTSIAPSDVPTATRPPFGARLATRASPPVGSSRSGPSRPPATTLPSPRMTATVFSAALIERTEPDFGGCCHGAQEREVTSQLRRSPSAVPASSRSWPGTRAAAVTSCGGWRAH